MNKRTIDIIACTAAVVIIAVGGFFVGKKIAKNKAAAEPANGTHSADYSESGTEQEEETVIVTDEAGETQIAVVDKNGETVPAVLDKDGHAVTKRPSGSASKNTTAGSGNKTNPAGGSTTKKPVRPTKPTAKPTAKPTINEDTPVDKDVISQQAGVFGFLWDENDKVFYSASDPWQRKWGYNKAYDFGAQFLVMYFDTVRIKFNYDGLDWMIQCWKGQYGYVLLGAEVGVYYKDETTDSKHYYCNDDANKLKVGYTCYNKGNVLFSRTYQNTWWLTGFVGGKLDRFADRSQLTLKVRITLKNEEMRDAFVEALQKDGVGFKPGNASDPDTFYTSGNDVFFMWKKNRAKTS